MAHQIEETQPSSEDEYDENADADFNPEAAAAEDEDASSSSEDEAAPAQPAEATTSAEPRGKKRKPEAVADGGLDSGDEATIRERQGKKKRRRKDKDGAGAAAEDDDSGGEGGLIKTRAQRLVEQSERKQRKKARDGEVTVDVEGLWEELSRIPVGRASTKGEVDREEEDKENDIPQSTTALQMRGIEVVEEEMITIKRRIEYAGEVTEIEERIPRSSKEAQQYLASHPEADPNHVPNTTAKNALHRPLKRPSLFEPNPLAQIKGVPPEKLRPRAPSRLDVVMAAQRAEAEAKKKAERMTTVQKSALDWGGFVDQQGLREELDEYRKSKRGFLEREEFLGRAEWAREVRGREARLKG